MSETHPSPHERFDVGVAAQRAAEEHLAAVWDAEEAYERSLDDDAHGDAQVPDSPASAPFDGCDTCVTRETLYAAWPVFLADILAQLRAAGHDQAAAHLEATN